METSALEFWIQLWCVGSRADGWARWPVVAHKGVGREWTELGGLEG